MKICAALRPYVATLFLSAACLASGCIGVRRFPAVPADLQERAVIPGMPTIRTWGDNWNPEFQHNVVEALRREQAHLAATGHTGPMPAASVLAISGGGANGAFGAGLLCGWTEAGNRPQFKAVTGISTGALIAPFAFVGAEQDSSLREFYTMTSTEDILKPRGLITGMLRDALSDTRPLLELLKNCVDQRMLGAIAEEYAKGRLLLIGTVDLDARR